MRVRVLGCSGGIGSGLRTTSLLIDSDVLIDCGTGVGDLTLDEMRALRHVFITHTHLDHIAALPLLVDTLFGELQERPLVIHAQPESMEVIRKHIFNWQIWPDFFELPVVSRPVVEFAEMQPGETIDLDGRHIEMVSVQHAVPAVAYCVDAEDASFAFSGDTRTNDAFWAAVNRRTRLDLLIVECAFAERQQTLAEAAGHYCPSTLAEDLGKLRHPADLHLTHLKPGEEDEIVAEVRARVRGRAVRRLTGGDRFEL
jgi:ribonuclease BN (tRNA processing enzyme)